MAKKEKELPTENNLTKKITRWLDQHSSLLGQKILLAGTDAEAACHLSRRMPEASVVFLTGSGKKAGSSDKNTQAGPAPNGSGQDMRDYLPVSADLTNYEGGLFDTVVYLGGTPLNLPAPGRSLPAWERGTLYFRKASLLMDCYEGEVQALRRHIRPGGSLLALVRSEHDEHLLGWCLAAAAEGLEIDISSLRQILCLENGEKQVLQAISAREGGRTDIGGLLAENLNYSLDRMNTAAEELQGEKAEILLQADLASLLRGYHIYQGEALRGKIAVYAAAQRPDIIYYYTDVDGDTPYLRRFHIQDQDKVIRHLVGELHRQKASDKSISWKQLELLDDWSEKEL